MRILHTADLHIGRQLHGFSLAEDHQVVLDQIVAALAEHQPDLFIIAGDIFDRPIPPASATKQFNRFLNRSREVCSAAIVAIAGNHDSGDRIEAMAIMSDPDHDLIRGALRMDELPLILRDTAGEVAVSALPFAYENAAKECFEDEGITSPEEVIKAQISAARKHVPAGARWVIVAHAFVAGGTSSESEKTLTRVGGIEFVSAEVFEGANYVALGHLHKPQTAGSDVIRYSGSPLAFGFDEEGSTKSMTLVDLQPDGGVDVSLLPLTPRRELRTVKGRLEELLSTSPSDDYLKIVLTDNTPQIEPMPRLRSVFPNACILTYERDERAIETKPDAAARRALLDDPIGLIGAFIEQTRDEPIREAEHPLVVKALADLRDKEASA